MTDPTRRQELSCDQLDQVGGGWTIDSWGTEETCRAVGIGYGAIGAAVGMGWGGGVVGGLAYFGCSYEGGGFNGFDDPMGMA